MAQPDNDGIVIIPDGNSNANTEYAAAVGSGGDTLADGTIVIDPASIGQSGSDGGTSDTGKRRRGRPRGSSNGTTTRTRTAKSPTLNITGLENILISTHAMLSAITKVEELQMDKEEAHMLAEAAQGVARHYDMTISAKAMDWTNLIMVAGSIYGSRIAAIRLRRSFEKGQQSGRPASNPVAEPASATTRKVNIPGVGEVDMPLN